LYAGCWQTNAKNAKNKYKNLFINESGLRNCKKKDENEPNSRKAGIEKVRPDTSYCFSPEYSCT